MSKINKIRSIIRNKGKGWVFTPKDFTKIATLNTINPTIDRLEKRSEFISIGHGLYLNHALDNEGKVVQPSIFSIIRALEKQLNDKFQFNGEYGMFFFGLVPQAPKEVKLLTNRSKNKNMSICGYDIILSKTQIPSPSNKYDKAILAIQTFRYIGKYNLSSDVKENILNQLNDLEKRKFKRISKPIEWINNLIF